MLATTADNDILFFGDTHGSFAHCLEVVRTYAPKAIVFLGDLQAKKPLHIELEQVCALTEVWWIHGNHDTDTVAYYDHLFASELADRNLDGKVAHVAGKRIAGLGGVFRGKVWAPQHGGWEFFSQAEFAHAQRANLRFRAGVPLKHRSTIFPETYMHLRTQQCDILVSHEAPSCNTFGFHALDRLAQQMGAQALFHGHHHDCYDYSEHFVRLGFKAYSVGLRGVNNLQGQVLRPGEEDGRYSSRVASIHGRKSLHMYDKAT